MTDLIKEISIKWHIIDVQERAEEMYDVKLSDEEASQILQEIDHRHDANIGVSWDVIDVYVAMHLEDKTSK